MRGQLTNEELETIQNLLDEAYGAVAWLAESIALSDRARTYKVKKLKRAIIDVETWLAK